jgi:bla regulator protein BlaR1
MSSLIDHLWQSTLFGTAVWLITLTLRANAATARHVLWLIASLKFLVPFSALYLLGAAAGLPTPVESQPPLLGLTTSAAAPVLAPAASLGAAHRGSGAIFVAMAFVIWMLGMAWVAAGWLRGWRMARSLVRAARPAPGVAPDVHVTDAAVEPSVIRVFRPVILLPAALLGRLDAAELAAVLAHERAHVARHDVLVTHLHRLVETLFWFHPLVWFIGAKITDERERACDEAVLTDGHDPSRYAAGILAVCRHCAGAHAPLNVAAIGGNLTGRIAHILAVRRADPVSTLKAIFIITCSLAAAAVPFVAGAHDGDLRRHAALDNNSRLLREARISIDAARENSPARPGIAATEHEVRIGRVSLRQLIALAYDVSETRVDGATPWLDSPRYDIRAVVRGRVADPDDLDPHALQGLVNELLARRFDLEIYVNQRCQDPCGRRALDAQ